MLTPPPEHGKVQPMTTQYDSIAATYDRIIGNLPVRQMLEYTYRARIGDVTGKSVLDLACGNGLYTRKFKQQGAARVVGVDLSPELIRIAQEHEAREKLGMEYQVGDGGTLGKLGDFDVVTTAFLLNYAPNRDVLLQMCRTVYDNLRGERFVAINLNVRQGARFYDDETYKKYGIFYHLTGGTLEHGASIHMTVAVGNDKVEFDVCHLPASDYEWALKTAGFKTVTWHDPQLSPELEQKTGGRAFWQDYLDTPSIIILECVK